MAASSSKTSEIPTSGCRDEVQPVLPSDFPKRADQPVTWHDIFLSHSGKQKGFVKDLYDELSHLGFNTFFDLTHHSLPLAENFPPHIFSAAKGCKLAVVVLSEEFVSSRWPMKELSAFVEAGVEILPLFFKLSPKDFKDDFNLKRWENAWEVFSKQDTRIKPTEWRNAIKVLRSKNGLTFEGEACEGETTYIRRVVSGIREKVPVEFKFDGPHIHGMNRLRQVILNNFKNMDSSEKVNVLGLYGLPGSGKSTLCQCLHDHFLPIYWGRSLCLELPTKPSYADLVQTFSKLVDLTDFKNRSNTSEISKLERLYNLLERYQLPSCRVFLVIDNISDDTWEAVRLFLPLVRGPGSKVILVARTFDILQPAFLLLKRYEQHYIWKDMEIPSIQETEAIQILLQTSCVGTVAGNLTPTQRETIVRIVRMCNFGSENYPRYLPLVMEAMGAMLIKYDGDFVGWGSDLQKFWDNVESYKEKTLIKLVEESFKALRDEKLQLLFFDLSLFIVPLHNIQRYQLDLHSLEEVYVLLSHIYDGRSAADIRLMIKDLKRHCFLTIDRRGLRIHDVYLEFAKSYSRSNSYSLRYSWKNDKYTRAKDDIGPVLQLKEVEAKDDIGPARTMILEMQGDGYERVELQSFSSLKALFVRNCKSLEVLGLVGLSSLASLDIVNCPNFRHVDGTLDLYNVKRLRISSPEGGQAGDKGGDKVAISFLHANRGWPGETLVARMRGLQDLRLENTGIRRLTDMGSCWPQLQNLRVKECYLEAFEVGNLPNLKSFYFSMDYFDYKNYKNNSDYMSQELRYAGIKVRRNYKPGFVLQGKGWLEGCPQLEQAEIEFALSEKGELGTLPPNLKYIRLGFFYPARIFPGFLPSADTALEQVDLEWCKKLEKISFLVEFRKLTRLEVTGCHSLVEITGLNFLFSLRTLFLKRCSNLRAILGPFDNLKMLETFVVSECPKLAGLAAADLENLVGISWLKVPLKRGRGRHHQPFNLKNLQNLDSLSVTSWHIIDDDESDCSTSTNMQQLGGNMLEGLEDLVYLRWLGLDGGRILHEHKHESTKPALSLSFSSLVGMNQPSTSHVSSSLSLRNLSDLASINGLDQLFLNLRNLHLEYLENLRSLQGIEGLVQLKALLVKYCPMLEEIPSLDTLVEGPNLRYANFNGCTSLVHLPISVEALTKFEERNYKGCPFSLYFEDCKFSRTEAMMAWAVNEDMPLPIRVASFHDLHAKFCRGDSSLREVLFDGLFPFLLNCVQLDDNECINFRNRELQEKVGGVAKKNLVQKFQAHPQCKLLTFSLLDEFGFSKYRRSIGKLYRNNDLPVVSMENIFELFDQIVQGILMGKSMKRLSRFSKYEVENE